MENLPPSITFLIITTLLYLPAHYVKFAWSGRGYTTIRYRIMATYNVPFAVLHGYIMFTKAISFYPEAETLLTELQATLFVALHLFAIPTEHKRRPWRLRKPFDFKIRRHEASMAAYKKAHLKKSRLMFWR